MSTGTRKTRLELTWIGKENRPRLEPRILLEDPEKSYHAKARRGKDDRFDNRLIFGDNLLALKALEAEFAGKIKCIYIDPPYNTGSAFTHYDDGIEHSLWLSLIRDRLEILRRLLSDDGSLWVSLDDNEGHYAKVLMDEVFGRSNFVANIIWQKKYAPANDAIWFSDSHDHILVFAKNKERWRPNRLERSEESNSTYKNPDNDPRGAWMSDNYNCNKSADERPNLYYAITQPNTGKKLWPKKTAVWRYNEETHKRHIAENRIWWGKDGTNEVPRYKRFLDDVDKGVVAQTIWGWREVGHNQDSKREQQMLHPDDPFGTPKPEALLHRIIEIGSNPGDWVLDSFAGSGTTGAVAHKMGRRWIMVELGEHCHTHIIPRLKKVIDGTDPGGVTEATGWKGGGGFRYSKLAPSLLKKDKFGQWVINPEYNAEMLAAALCKVEGFTYAPSTDVYWQHGHSTENDFIYVTTQTTTRDQLQKLSDEVGPNRSLLIMCRAFRAKIGKGEFPNLTVRKIPKAVLSKCEWDKDDYSLEIKTLPKAEIVDDEPLDVQSSGGGVGGATSTVEPKGKGKAGGSGAKNLRRKVAAALNGDSLFGKEGK
ncbi:MAG: site-specific DNA-methyltransferase [Phycisphaerales bacterium]|nr:site-specific DNA-methyltransferase [Phycisphaerales bacterium]